MPSMASLLSFRKLVFKESSRLECQLSECLSDHRGNFRRNISQNKSKKITYLASHLLQRPLMNSYKNQTSDVQSSLNDAMLATTSTPDAWECVCSGLKSSVTKMNCKELKWNWYETEIHWLWTKNENLQFKRLDIKIIKGQIAAKNLKVIHRETQSL